MALSPFYFMIKVLCWFGYIFIVMPSYALTDFLFSFKDSKWAKRSALNRLVMWVVLFMYAPYDWIIILGLSNFIESNAH